MGEFGGDGDDFGTVSGGENGDEVSEGTTEASTGEIGGESGAFSSSEPGTGAEITQGDNLENASVVNNSEFSIIPSSTSVGTSQILETPSSMEQAQQSVENYHQQSLEQIMEMNGQFIPDSQKERIGSGVQDIKAVEYNPESRVTGSFTFHNNKNSISVSNINETQMERTTKHETNHFTSFNREIIVPGEKGYTVHKTSGLRQSSYFHPAQGPEIPLSSKNRGMNEGITTMYTNQQLEALDPAKGAEAARQTGYVHATEISQELESIVGKETIAQAYYGGNIAGLEGKVNELGGDKAFENLSKCMDKVTYSTDPAERMTAMREAQDILATMSERVGKKMINYIFDYLESKGIYALSDKEQAAMELGISRFLQENGIRVYETRDYHRSYALRLMNKVDDADLKQYFINYHVLSEVNQIIIEARSINGVPEARKICLYSLMESLHKSGLGEKYVPIYEIKQILGKDT